MSELQYQLDLMKAMNQKLSTEGKRYQLVCNTSYSAFLYYSFETKENSHMGKWDDFFDFRIHDYRDLERIYELMEEPFIDELKRVINLEKSGEKEAVVECMMRNKRVWLEFRTHVVYDPEHNPTEKIITITDITKFRIQNEELKYLAYYDSSTGLYNRNYFIRLLGEYIRKAREEHEKVSVILIDIDDFRKINDGLGIIVGDELVQQFGSFLKEFSGDDIIISHLNSDVYCMAIYNPVGERAVENIYRKIKERTTKFFSLSGGQELSITVSVGVAEYPESAKNTLELINCAEIVMFRGKALGKDNIQYFDTPILNEFLKNVELENKLKEAVFNQNFEMYYQPQFFAGNKKLRGMEALVRWKDDDNHMISPALFIPIAEKNGSIIPIGDWVLEQSLKQFAEWKKHYMDPLIISINISSLQLMKKRFIDELLMIINKYHLNYHEIELEITESVLIEDFDKVTEKLKSLRDYGIRISLDDFGTGFSSLSYLKSLPIDTLKIDKSFVDTVLLDSTTRVITENIINMVKTLGLETVAEGVEQEQQYKYLHAIGCDIIQGYLFGRPFDADDMKKILMKAMEE